LILAQKKYTDINRTRNIQNNSYVFYLNILCRLLKSLCAPRTTNTYRLYLDNITHIISHVRYLTMIHWLVPFPSPSNTMNIYWIYQERDLKKFLCNLHDKITFSLIISKCSSHKKKPTLLGPKLNQIFVTCMTGHISFFRIISQSFSHNKHFPRLTSQILINILFTYVMW